MDNKRMKNARLFLGSFFLTGIMIFAFFGFVLVENSYSTYGLSRKPLYTITNDDSGITISAMGRSLALPKPPIEINPTEFVFDYEQFFIPRSVRLVVEIALLAGTSS